MIAYKQGVTLYNKLFSGKFPMIPVVNLIAPVGFGLMNVPVLTQVIQKPIETRQMVKNTDSQLTLTTKFRFANYHKPAPQQVRKQAKEQTVSKPTIANTSTNPVSNPPPTSTPPPSSSNYQSSSSDNAKPLYTIRDMFIIMMSSIGVFMWGQILLKQYYKKQPPIPLQPAVIIQKPVEKPQPKPQQEQSVGLLFMLFLMCLFVIAAEFYRMRSFDKMYQELRNVHKVLKEEVHGIQLQLIRERLGSL